MLSSLGLAQMKFQYEPRTLLEVYSDQPSQERKQYMAMPLQLD